MERAIASPAVRDSGGLHEAGRVRLLEQLLRVGHEARLLQQTLLLRDLPQQGLALPGAGALQGGGQGALSLHHGRPQLADGVRQLVKSHRAVCLQVEGDQEERPEQVSRTQDATAATGKRV